MRVWDLRTAQDVRILGCVSSAECVEFSRDGRLVAASDAAGDVSIFDLPSGRRVGTCSAGGSDTQITGLSFSHNGWFPCPLLSAAGLVSFSPCMRLY